MNLIVYILTALASFAIVVGAFAFGVLHGLGLNRRDSKDAARYRLIRSLHPDELEWIAWNATSAEDFDRMADARRKAAK